MTKEVRKAFLESEMEWREILRITNCKIRTIKNTPASVFKSVYGLNILFNDRCDDFTFGIDSCYKYQAFTQDCKNKKEVLEVLSRDKENIINYCLTPRINKHA